MYQRARGTAWLRPAVAALGGAALIELAALAALRRRRRPAEADQPRTTDGADAVLRIVGAVDDYLYTNEHCADGTRRSVFSGPNREKLMGGPIPPGTDIAAEWERLIHPDDWEQHIAHRQRLRDGRPSEVRYRLRGYDGRDRWIHARTRPHHVDGRVFVDGIVSDVTTQVEAEHALGAAQEELRRLADVNEHQALHDPLTHLGNRRKLLADLQLACTHADEAAPWLLIMFDLDGFKAYNDAFGHPAGDALLIRLAQRLRLSIAPEATCYRLGGDEFCVLTSANDIDVEATLAALSTALSEDGDGFRVTSSFGAVFLPEEASDPTRALNTADQRLYNEKRARQTRRGRLHDVLLQALHERQPDLEEHSARVARLALAVATELGLDPETLESVNQGALLHDIGKIGIPDSILHKPAPLDDAEWDFVKRHTIIGERILAASPTLRRVAQIVRASHERWDGNGYPDGLAAEEIPFEARIIAACDAYATMTTARPYRAARTPGEALDELQHWSGAQFDPAVVRQLVAVLALLPDHGRGPAASTRP